MAHALAAQRSYTHIIAAGSLLSIGVMVANWHDGDAVMVAVRWLLAAGVAAYLVAIAAILRDVRAGERYLRAHLPSASPAP